MNRTFRILSRTESAVTAVCASVLSLITVGAVFALFASASPDAQPPVVISASKSA
jgi:hypothetical protein